MDNTYFNFLDQLDDKAVVENAKALYRSIFENNFAQHLKVPDSISQDAVNPQMPAKLVGVNNGTSAPDMVGKQKILDTLQRPTRGGNGHPAKPDVDPDPDCMHNQIGETQNEEWVLPPFAKNFHTVPKNASVEKLKEMAGDHLPNPMVMGVPYSTQPMHTGFTINSNWTNPYKPGVDAGYAGGGGSAPSGGGNAG